MMNGSLAVALVLLQPTGPHASPLEGPRWTRLSGRPSKSQSDCVPYREDFWSVSLDNGAVFVRPRSIARVLEPLPFKHTPRKDQGGDRRVLEVADGWLVGFVEGEWVVGCGGSTVTVGPPGNCGHRRTRQRTRQIPIMLRTSSASCLWVANLWS